MVSSPRVMAICPTADRQLLTDRAVRSFMAQTYENCGMIILDNGNEPYEPREGLSPNRITYRRPDKKPIGALRNDACELAIANGAEIIIHWDSDDVSHPRRIAWQVIELQLCDVTGYSDVLFWDTTKCQILVDPSQPIGTFLGVPCDLPKMVGVQSAPEAWLYEAQRRNYLVSASLCYWAKTWQSRKFPAISLGESREFVRDRKIWVGDGIVGPVPALICGIHGGNVNNYDVSRGPGTHGFKRVPEWDNRIRKIMEAA